MASENIMMSAVLKGGNRQELHERIRVHSLAAAKNVKEEGGKNDLIERICADKEFGLELHEVEKVLTPELYTGLAPEQTENFVKNYIKPILDSHKDELGIKIELTV